MYPSEAAKERALRGTAIFGLNSRCVREKATQHGDDVTLEFIMKLARQEVATERHLMLIQDSSTTSVDYL